MIDWGATGDMLAGAGAIGGAIAVSVAAILGKTALKDIQIQRQTERRMEHAEKILTIAYELQSALDSIRHPMSTSGELEASRRELEEAGHLAHLTEDGVKKLIQANVFYIRSRYFDEQFTQAQRLVPFAAAFFGDDIKNALSELIHNRHKVRVYADAYARDHGHDKDFDKKIQAAIWKGFGVEPGQDEISELTQKSIDTLERHLFPIIRVPEKRAR